MRKIATNGDRMPTATPIAIAGTIASQTCPTSSPRASTASSTSSAVPPATPIVGLSTPPGAPAPSAAVVPTSFPTTNARASVSVADRDRDRGRPSRCPRRAERRLPRDRRPPPARRRRLAATSVSTASAIGADEHAELEEQPGDQHGRHRDGQSQPGHAPQRAGHVGKDGVVVEQPLGEQVSGRAPPTPRTTWPAGSCGCAGAPPRTTSLPAARCRRWRKRRRCLPRRGHRRGHRTRVPSRNRRRLPTRRSPTRGRSTPAPPTP